MLERIPLLQRYPMTPINPGPSLSRKRTHKQAFLGKDCIKRNFVAFGVESRSVGQRPQSLRIFCLFGEPVRHFLPDPGPAVAALMMRGLIVLSAPSIDEPRQRAS